VGDLVQNTVEAELVRQVTETLLRSGIREDQIGIISLYRQQVKLFSFILQDRKEIEILTADRSQGRDKDCIIISMVRSNDGGHVCGIILLMLINTYLFGPFQVGDLVKDWRRMNVSFTRARSKLIIVGSRKTLQHADLLAEFFNLMDSRGWILSLPPNAQTLHSCLMEPAPATSTKRVATEMETSVPGKENTLTPRPLKKAKIKATADNGLLRGRPILKDLINATT
jgi:DNA replication ATP-dependent helicase Dna2